MRILLVEDHPLTAAGLRTCVGAEHEVVHVIANGDEVVPWLRSNAVDVVLLDLSLPKRSGAELLHEIRQLAPAHRVIVLTMNDDIRIQNWMMAIGAKGFVSKNADVDVLRRAVGEVAAGREWFPDAEVIPPGRRHASRWTPELRVTQRQFQVLWSMADSSRKVTAARLHISEYTVDEHLAALRRVFKVATNSALIRAAIEHGILPQLSVPGSPPP